MKNTVPGRPWMRRLATAIRTRWRPTPRSSQRDFARLGLTRLEDRVVLDAAAAAVVADVNPGVLGSSPAELTPYNGNVYFSASGTNASGQSVGRELFKLDSTGNVSLVANINPGSADSNPSGFTQFNGDLIFAATGPQGRELYRLDTAGNVTLFANVNPGTASSNPESLVALDNKLFFTAEVNLGRELYIANQGGGVSLVADLLPGTASSNPSGFVVFEDILVFAATNANGRGLYHVHAQGSSTPGAINLGTGVSDPQGFTEYFGNLYFSALHPTEGRELFVMHINNNGQEVVNRIANFDNSSASSSPSGFFVFQNSLYFAATTSSGRELFRVINDGDADDTQFLDSDDYQQFDIAPGSASSSPSGFAAFNNAMYFTATVNGQRGLYRLSGDSIVPVTLPTEVTLATDTKLTPLSNGLYFAANGPNGREVYILDAAGIVSFVDVNPGINGSDPAEIIQFAGKTYFVATASDVGRELFVLTNLPSSVRIDNGVLTFRDEAGDRDNRIVVYSDGTRLHIVDQNGFSIALLTSISGATGGGSNEVILPFSSLVGVNSLSINTRGGNDSVTYDLSANASTLLSRFTTLSYDGGANNDALRFVGDGALQASYTPDRTTTGVGVVIVSGTATSSFSFSNLEPVDFTGFAIASLIAPDTSSDVDLLTIANGKDSLNGTSDAIIVSGTVGGTLIESAYFFGNGTVVIDTSTGSDSPDTVTIASASNAHANANLRVKTFGNGLFGQDAVVVNGAVTLAGSFVIDTTQLTINATVSTGGNISLTALHDVVMSANGRLLSNNAPIRVIGDANGVFGGGIVMADGALINAGSGTIFLQATDDITLGRIVTTNSSSAAIQVASLAGRVLDGGDSGGANLEANGNGAVVTINAVQGVGASGNALELAVRQLVVVTNNANQYLNELDNLERLDLRAGTGQVNLTAGGAIQDTDADTDVQGASWNVQAAGIGTLANPIQTRIDSLTANVTSGSLYLTQVSGNLAVANVTAPGASAVVDIVVQAGDLNLNTITASDANSLVVLQTPSGAIRDNNGATTNLIAHAAELAASQGVGVSNALETTLIHLTANGGTGGVFIQNSGDLELGNVPGILGLVGVSASNANLQINATGTLLVTQAVQTSGSGAISLTTSNDILVNAPIIATLGSLSLTAGRDIVATAGGDLSTTQGAVALTTARAMALGSGASITTTAGSITLLANQGVTPTSGSFTGISLSGATLTSTSGNITLQGKSGTGTNNAGIELLQGSTINTAGAIVLTGVSLGTGTGADGVRLAGASSIQTSASGNITVTGSSGASGSGLRLSGSSGINALGTGNVLLAGTGSGGNADLAWDDLTISKTGGTYTFQDTVQGGSLTVLPGAYQVRFLDGGFIQNQVTFQNTGGVVLGNQNSDSLTFAGGLTSTASITTLQGTIATQGTNITLGTTQLVGQVTLATAGGNLTAGEVQGANVPLTIQAGTGQVTLANPANIIGDLTITAGTLQLTEQDNITQSGAWHIAGLTQLNASGFDILLTNPANTFGPLQLQANNINLVAANSVELQASQWQGLFQVNTPNSISVTGLLQGNGPLTLTAGSDILVNAPIVVTSGSMSLTAGRDIVATAGGDLSTTQGAVALTAARAMALGSGASITTTAGAITLLANQGVTPTSGSFTGISLSGATLTSTSGNITLQGKSGTGTNNAGIELLQGSTINTAGAIVLTGVSLGTGTGADGVRLAGASSIQTSASGNITVTGSSGASGSGLRLSGSSGINALGTGNVLLAGTGSGGNADIAWDDLTISKTGGTYTFQDTVQGITLTVLPGAYQVRFLDGGFIQNQVTFQNTGGVVLGNQNSDSLTFAGGLVSTAGSTTLQGTIATQGTNLTLGTTQLVGQVTLATAGGNLTTGEVQGANVPLTIQAGAGQVTLANSANIIGDLTITAGTLQLTEQDNITQAGAWHITGSTQLKASGFDILLTNATNTFGPLQLQANNINLVAANSVELQASQWQGLFQVNTPNSISVTGSLQGNGTITLQAQGDLFFAASAAIDAALLGANVNLLASGGINMANGSLIQSGSGAILLQASNDITLGRLITTNTTSVAIQITSLAGSVFDGGDSGGANLEANGNGAVVTINAGLGVGTAANPLELAVRQLVVVTNNSNQYLGELDNLERIDLRAGTGQIVFTAGGAIQDNDGEVDVQATVWNVQATEIGAPANPLQTRIGTLAANITTGSLYLSQVSDNLGVASVTAPGASAVVNILVQAGDLQLSTITASDANSLVVLQTPSGAISDTNGAANNLTAHSAELIAARGIGVGNALETALSTLSASGGTGGLFIQNTGDLRTGSLTASNANMELSNSGKLTIGQSVHTTGSGAIVLSATGDLQLLAAIANEQGSITLSTANNLTATIGSDVSTRSGAILLAPGGTLTFDANILVGSGSVAFTIVDAASQMRGVVSGTGGLIKQGLGTLTLTSASQNTYTGTTDLLAGTLRVDGAIGANAPAQRFTLVGSARLTGGGTINAPIFSSSLNTVISPTGNLQLGDGSEIGFDFAGQLFIANGQIVMLRDANLAQLGLFTSIASGGKLWAANGVEVGGGEMLAGSGAVAGNIVALAGSFVSPGNSPGVLSTDRGDVLLNPNAQLIVQVTGTSAGSQYDQLGAIGTVTVEGAILNVQGGLFRPDQGFVFVVLVNDGVDPISGRFRDVNGQTLNEGSSITFGGITATLSYAGGIGGNDVTLTVKDRITIVQTQSPDAARPVLGGRAQAQEVNFQLARSIVVPPPVIVEAPPPPLNTAQTEVRSTGLELRQAERIRVFFRIVNGATDKDEPKQYELDPNVLRDILGFFNRFKFQDNHYRIYLQEPGKKERLILDVHIVDGRIVPPNFRETEGQGTKPEAKPANEQPSPAPDKPTTPPDAVVPEGNSTNNGPDAKNQPVEPATKMSGGADPSWQSRLRAALAEEQPALDKVGRLMRKAR